MFIAFDIGNSRIKTGVFDNEKMVSSFSSESVSEALNLLKNFQITAAAVSSVVPAKLNALTESLKKSGCDPFIICHDSTPGFKLNYKTPQTLGPDRICSVAGALSLYLFEDLKKEISHLISIDFGTATTVNILKLPDQFIGGTIAPGPGLMIDSLHQRTSQLPRLNKFEHDKRIGNDTFSSIEAGVVNSIIGGIERCVYSIDNYNRLAVYVTGGNAELLMKFLPFDFRYEKSLVLCGVRFIAKQNGIS